MRADALEDVGNDHASAYGVAVPTRSHLMRLRLGILLIVLSWFPFAQILIGVARDHGYLTDDSAARAVRLVVWGIQILVGLVGLLLVGRLAVAEAKRAGWRRTPGHLWRLFWRGSEAV
jgi:hypothetical protein